MVLPKSSSQPCEYEHVQYSRLPPQKISGTVVWKIAPGKYSNHELVANIPGKPDQRIYFDLLTNRIVDTYGRVYPKIEPPSKELQKLICDRVNSMPHPETFVQEDDCIRLRQHPSVKYERDQWRDSDGNVILGLRRPYEFDSEMNGVSFNSPISAAVSTISSSLPPPLPPSEPPLFDSSSSSSSSSCITTVKTV